MGLINSASRYWLLIAVFAGLGQAALQTTTPIALITEVPAGARIRRAQSQTSLPLYLGDLIFPGDTLLSPSGSVRFSFCPNATAYSFRGSELRLESSGEPKAAKDATLTNTGATPCRLPAVTPSTYRDVRTGADRLQVEAAPQAAQPAPPFTATQQREIEQLNQMLARNPKDLTVLLARAIALEGANDLSGAVRDYQTISQLAPMASWVPNEMRAVLARRDRLATGIGKVIGVVIGISDYMNLKAVENLQYADRDAASFYDFLISPRGGARPADVVLLLNDKAKLADVTLAIDDAFAKARPEDEVVIFIAAHGVPVVDGENAGAYIMAYDSSQEEPSSMYGMSKLQEVTDDRLRPQKVQLIADTCHAAFIGGVDVHKGNLFMAEFADQRRATTKVLGLLASGTNESSYECSNLDRGHGAFTYFLLSGLNSNTAAVDDTVQQITVYSLFEYVRRNVLDFTHGLKSRQTPEKRGVNMNDTEVLARVDLPGVPIAPAVKPAAHAAVCDGGRGLPALSSIRPGETTLPPDKQAVAEQLNAGQEVILRYLKGEQVAMTSEDFRRGENSFAAASRLQGGTDAYTEARLLFCQGRRLVFEKQYPQAIDTLERAIRLDRFGAYAYNALGIAFLESADFVRAIAAFQDAVRLAPYWAYARHNLALAFSQNGQYDQAIASYRQAMRLGQEYLYIPFNLGLLYQRLNRPQEARTLWLQVLRLSPNMAKAENALGLSFALEGRAKKAEAYYRTALGMATEQVDRLAVRHNLALLLVSQNRTDEALKLWRMNLEEDKNDLPTLTALSTALADSGDKAEAEKLFLRLLTLKPGYVGARLKYATLLQREGKYEQAAEQLTELLKYSPDDAAACEMLGDLRANQLNRDSALALYDRALNSTTGREDRRRLKRKKQALALH